MTQGNYDHSTIVKANYFGTSNVKASRAPHYSGGSEVVSQKHMSPTLSNMKTHSIIQKTKSKALIT